MGSLSVPPSVPGPRTRSWGPDSRCQGPPGRGWGPGHQGRLSLLRAQSAFLAAAAGTFTPRKWPRPVTSSGLQEARPHPPGRAASARFPEGTFTPAGAAHVCPPPAGRRDPVSSPPCPLSPQVNDENVVKVGHRQVVNMIRQGGNHLVLKVVTVTRNLDPDDTARKKGALPAASPARRVGGGQGSFPPAPCAQALARCAPSPATGGGGGPVPCPRVGNKSEREVRRGLGLAHREWWAASGQGCAQLTGAWGLLLQTDLHRSL